MGTFTPSVEGNQTNEILGQIESQVKGYQSRELQLRGLISELSEQVQTLQEEKQKTNLNFETLKTKTDTQIIQSQITERHLRDHISALTSQFEQVKREKKKG